jgi:pimeloyl-ACP methyl ester carboxylesterase
MGADEEGTLASLTAHRTELIEPCITEHRGRVVKTTGDGLLAVFASVVDAVRCAVAFQEGMRERNVGYEEDKRIVFRIGVNLGDIIIQDNDVYGDGVNIAARLESLAEGGGICISGDVYRQVRGRVEVNFEEMGEKQVKNIPEPIQVYRIKPDGGAPKRKASTNDSQNLQQEIRFCAASDGVRIAYATAGQGPPLVKAANWLNHLEYDWQSPVWRHLLHELAQNNSLIRYDERGNGLSDWDVSDISFEAFVRDLETVVDAVGLDRFPLLGISQGCSVSIAYAVRHPGRVSHLVLYGGYARGRRMRGSQEAVEQEEAIVTLMRQGWGQENPVFRQIFTSLFIPEATSGQIKWFNDLQRMTASPENAVRLRNTFGGIDVTNLLPEVTVPTLVLHCRNEVAVPFDEGRLMATMIPGARFVALEGQNHLILEDEPAWPRFLDEVKNFLGKSAT